MSDNIILLLEKLEEAEEYWKQKLEGDMEGIMLPADFPEAGRMDWDVYEFILDDGLSSELMRISRMQDLSLYILMLAAFKAMLFVLLDRSDICIASPAYNNGARANGSFVLLRDVLNPAETFKELIMKIRQTVCDGYKYQYYPESKIIEYLGDIRPLSRIVFALEGIHQSEALESIMNSNPVDVVCLAARSDSMIKLAVRYNRMLYKKETIMKIFQCYKNILAQSLSDTSCRLEEFELVSGEERNAIINQSGLYSKSCNGRSTLHAEFEKQARRTPEKAAIYFEGRELTYRELSDKSDRLKEALMRQGAKPGDIIGIMVQNSIGMAVGILGVLKAGGAYLPLDPSYPQDRLMYMLKDSGTHMLLTTACLKDRVCFDGSVLLLDDESIYQREAGHPAPPHCAPYGREGGMQAPGKPGDAAYVIYTSGSSGEPKAVVVEHEGVLNFISWRIRNYFITENDVILQMISFSFDAFGTNFYSGILSGGMLVLLDGERWRDFGYVNGIIKKLGVTNISTVPSLYRGIIENAEYEDIKSLAFVVLGGEKSDAGLIEQSKKLSPGIKIINEYGPTENSITTTVLMDMKPHMVSVIGRPIDGSRVYILSESNKIIPAGLPGELCVSGIGLARGYLNKPALTEEKFVKNPFDTDQRMYRTGDMARWLADGNIEYIGRLDGQVKVRGYRIEPGEIESRILRHKAVRQAAVIAVKDENRDVSLLAYVVGNITAEELRSYLEAGLPYYMVPSEIIALESLPLTPNGKVDKKALSGLSRLSGDSTSYEAPVGEIEERLADLWKELLGKEKIGRNDNFFKLGGHSLKAALMVTRIHKAFNADITLTGVFQNPVLWQLAKAVAGSGDNIYSSIMPAGKREYYPLSSAQKRLFILNKFEITGTGYNMPGVMTVEGRLDMKRFEAAFNGLIKRHETLRTSFKVVGMEPVQVVHDEAEFGIHYLKSDGTKLDELIAEFVVPFDLSKAPLMRVSMVEISKDKHMLLFDMHHIISDGTSMGILVNEFILLYKGAALPPLRIQYKDFSEWQNSLIKSGQIKKQEEYWLNRFQGELPVLELPLDYKRPALQSFDGEVQSFEVDKELAMELKSIAVKNGATLYMLLLACYNILLSRLSGQEDIVIGTPAAGRPHADLENIIGMFVNTLAMRNFPEGNKTFIEFLNEVKENFLAAYENQDYQFEELVEKLNVARDMGRSPIFDTMFTFQDMDQEMEDTGELSFTPYSYSSKVSKFDISLKALEDENGFNFGFEYCTALFKERTIQRMGMYFMNILQSIAHKPWLKLHEIDMLSDEERNKVLYDFNNTRQDYNRETTVHELFEARAGGTPGKTALVCGGKSVSYMEVNNRANHIAYKLMEAGIGRGDTVGLLAEASIETVISILGIMKAGAAYVPIDPAFPGERVGFILEDSGSEVLLAAGSRYTALEVDKRVIDMDLECLNENPVNPDSTAAPDDPAYMIYTSGTTGKPKGVVIENRSLINYAGWFSGKAGLKAEDRSMLVSSICFDLGYTSLYPALLSGCELHIVPKEIYSDPDELIEYIGRNQITYFKATPSLFSMLVNSRGFERTNSLSCLRLVVLGGEQIKTGDIESFNSKYPHVSVMNHYGPTETTIGSVAGFIDFDNFQSFKAFPVIGKPINNTNIYILDKYQKPAGIGAAGEIYISGAGLARGYLNRPDLDGEKFVANPFPDGYARMYRTGDIARYMEDGSILFIGRADHQVKIRGYRVELLEVEKAILDYEGIEEASVQVWQDDNANNQLCAYITAGMDIEVSGIRQYLLERLPDYMVPACFMKIPNMPLTPNGKIDRRSLPHPSYTSGEDYEPPVTLLEEKVLRVWEYVLNRKKIGVNDNFFMSGGSSLNVIFLAARLYEEFMVDIPLVKLMKNTTIREIAAYMEQAGAAADTGIDEEPIMLLNKKRKKNIFAFPHAAAYGLALAELARHFGRHSLYAFDFIESDDRIEKYVSLITSYQKEGPYVLLGYSLGGNLAFEVAKGLKERGYEVSDLILLDSVKREVEENRSAYDIEKEISETVGQLEDYFKSGIMNISLNESLKNSILRKMRNYLIYGNTLINAGEISSRIHLICSEEADSDEYSPLERDNIVKSWDKWAASAAGAFIKYQGSGKHDTMIDGEYARKNAQIAESIDKL